MSGSTPAARILVGDDETQICRLIRDVLQSDGYAIDVTRDGGKFLERYPAGDYSLLLLDTLLRSTSGMEVVMKLRDRGDAIPIILLSGPGQESTGVEAFAFTYRVDVLRSAVRRALGDPHPD